MKASGELISDRDLESLADAWIRYQQAALRQPSGVDEKADFTAVKVVSELSRRDPRSTIALIRVVLAKVSDEEMLAVLAAGPLEDVLAKHGAEVIDDVENLAHQDHRFRELLFGVWKNMIDAATWERLERLRRDH
mgnify:CR=1 FL=1|jgi:hypothetical protein